MVGMVLGGSLTRTQPYPPASLLPPNATRDSAFYPTQSCPPPTNPVPLPFKPPTVRRRYADVVVHRQLLAAVGADGEGSSSSSVQSAATAAAGGLRPSLAALPLPPPPPLPGAEVADKAAVMNERHRTAKRAQKDCSDLYLLLLLHAQVRLPACWRQGLVPAVLLLCSSLHPLHACPFSFQSPLRRLQPAPR